MWLQAIFKKMSVQIDTLLSFMKNCYWMKVTQQIVSVWDDENTNAFLIKSHIMDTPQPNINTASDISVRHHNSAALHPIMHC